MGAESAGGDHLSVSLWWRARLFYSTSPESRINSALLVFFFYMVAADIPPVGGASEDPPQKKPHPSAALIKGSYCGSCVRVCVCEDAGLIAVRLHPPACEKHWPIPRPNENFFRTFFIFFMYLLYLSINFIYFFVFGVPSPLNFCKFLKVHHMLLFITKLIIIIVTILIIGFILLLFSSPAREE